MNLLPDTEERNREGDGDGPHDRERKCDPHGTTAERGTVFIGTPSDHGRAPLDHAVAP